MTPLEEALPLILADVEPRAVAPELVALADCLGRVLALDIFSAVAVPYDDNSAMDGYAVHSSDGLGPVQVTQRIPAGTCGTQVSPGTAARIFTGAPIPPGADAVVMQENTELDGDTLILTQAVKAGENIRGRGQDIAEDDLVFASGRCLHARTWVYWRQWVLARCRYSRN
jgi:molybdopterin molybdotransferase